MRIAHFTDLHLYRPPSPRQLLGKRFLGWSNLTFTGRGHRFQEGAIRALMRDLPLVKPDLLLCTGDLTAMGSPEEFQDIREYLDPLLRRFPAIMVPGNHDCYTWRAARERRFEKFFGSHTGDGRWPAVHRFGDVAFVGLNPCRYHPLLASGRLPQDQLQALDRLLSGPDLDGCFVVLFLHYPLRHPHGAPYGPWTRNLVNGAALEEVLLRTRRVGLALHGHAHNGFNSRISRDTYTLPILNPGAAGYGCSPERTGRFRVYEITGAGLQESTTWAFDGERFSAV